MIDLREIESISCAQDASGAVLTVSTGMGPAVITVPFGQLDRLIQELVRTRLQLKQQRDGNVTEAMMTAVGARVASQPGGDLRLDFVTGEGPTLRFLLERRLGLQLLAPLQQWSTASTSGPQTPQ